MFQSRIITAILMISVAAFSRILPHPPNFSPLLAVSLFSGAFLLDKRIAYVVPLLAMFVSDLYLGFHELIPVVYLSLLLFVYLGTKLSDSLTLKKSLGFTFVSSLFFFLVTNFAVWLTSGIYPLNGTGLIACFTLALPFFQNSLLGDLTYAGILFGSMVYLDKSVFSKEKPVFIKS
jgi:hypothetical protein